MYAKDCYNGWTNRATWLVNIHFNLECCSDVLLAKHIIEEQYYEMSNGVLKDMLDLSEINWQELMDHFAD